MEDLSNIISIGYLVIGVLVFRRLFKRNRLFRCSNCGKMGVSIISQSNKDSSQEDVDVLDIQEVKTDNNFPTTYHKCVKCGVVVKV